MQRSKSLALMFLLGALLVGGALGFAADRVILRDHGHGRPGGHEAMRKDLAERLRLTPPQRVAVDSILDRRHRDMKALWAPMRPRMDAIRDTARAQIMRLLDERQRAEFERLVHKERTHKRVK